MSTTTLEMIALLSEAIGDFREFDTSTNITTGSTASVIATTLANYDSGQNDYFNDWWLYITEGNNSGVNRNVKDWLTTATTLKLRGAAFASESSAVTCRLHRFSRVNKLRAINRAIEQLFPSLFKEIDDLTLVTGNSLPDGSFEWWTSSSASKFYTCNPPTTLTQTTALYFYRGQRGTTSMKVNAGAADTYAFIDSYIYPRLLDLMGKTVDFYCWCSASTANDAWIQIHTIKADGTAQNLPATQATSTVDIPARSATNAKWTLLKEENQTLNDDVVRVELRFRVDTNGEDAYFDDAILRGRHLFEYLLPEDLQTGKGSLSQVYVQRSGYSDQPAYDLHPRLWSKEGHSIIDDGTYRYLRLDDLSSDFRRIRLLGYMPLETLSADTDTIALEGAKLNLIVAQAAYNLYIMERGLVSSEDKGRYERELYFWANEVRRLQPTLQMMRPSHSVRNR